MGRDFRSGRGNGRGGRGFNRRKSTSYNSNRNSSTNTKPSKKKTINDHVFTLGSAEQANDYNVTMDYIINYIFRTFDKGYDVAMAIKDEIEPDIKSWKPTMGVASGVTTGAEKVAEEMQIIMEYKAEYALYCERKSMYEDNMIKSFALLWDRCSKSMQFKISLRLDYESDIYANPIKLKIAIREHATNFQGNRYF